MNAVILCLAMTIYYEARSEPILGQYYVADVVMNRADWQPHRVCAEVYKPKQFSPFNKPQPVPPSNSRWIRALAIAQDVIKHGRQGNKAGKANHFYWTGIYPYWASSCQPIATIGQHHFCYIPRKVK